MTRPVTVHLLRHGEVFNPEHVLYGRLPGFSLSARGVAMAQRIAEVLGAVRPGPARVGLVVSSPLQRARETAAPTAEALAVAVTVDDRLTEAANLLQGRHLDRSVLRDPAFLRSLAHPLRPGWGEPYTEIAARMWTALADVAGRADVAGSAALVVSHQLPIWTARRFGERRPLWHDPRRRRCSLASLTTLTFDATRLSGPVAADALRDALVGIDYSEPAHDLLAGADDVMRPQAVGT